MVTDTFGYTVLELVLFLLWAAAFEIETTHGSGLSQLTVDWLALGHLSAPRTPRNVNILIEGEAHGPNARCNTQLTAESCKK